MLNINGGDYFYGVDFRDVGVTLHGGILIYGAQLEQQSYATSYIPTSGASSTRLRDLASGSGNSTLINSTEGVLYAEIAALAKCFTRWYRQISLTQTASGGRKQ